MHYSTKFRHVLQELKPCLKQQFRDKCTLKKSGQRQVPWPTPSWYFRHQVATFKKSFDKLGGLSFSRLYRPWPMPSAFQHQIVSFKKSFDKLGSLTFTRLFTYVRVRLFDNGLYRIGQWRSIIGPQTGQIRAEQNAANKIGIYEKVQNVFRIHLLRDRFLFINQLKNVDKELQGPGKRGRGGKSGKTGGGFKKKGAGQKGRPGSKKSGAGTKRKKKPNPRRK